MQEREKERGRDKDRGREKNMIHLCKYFVYGISDNLSTSCFCNFYCRIPEVVEKKENEPPSKVN